MFATLAEFPNLMTAAEFLVITAGFLTGLWLGDRHYRRGLDPVKHAAILADRGW